MPIQQVPIGSPFKAANTAEDVIEGITLTGKTVIVTGGYSGLGLEAARVLLGAGAKVIVPARNIEKAKENLEGLDVTVEQLDLMDPASIDAFADRFLAEHETLDILINCAGVMANPLTRDARGYESQFSTNVLGHFQLTARLWPALVAADKARVVFLSSANHRGQVVDFLHDPNFENREYAPWVAYGNSKAANVLLSVAFDSIGEPQGVRVFSVHPGGIFDTGLVRHMDLAIAKQAGMIDDEGNPIIDPERGWKTPEQGASTIVWGATSPLLDGKGGVYLTNNEVGKLLPTDDDDKIDNDSVKPGVIDPVNAGRLWRLCEELTGARID